MIKKNIMSLLLLFLVMAPVPLWAEGFFDEVNQINVLFEGDMAVPKTKFVLYYAVMSDAVALREGGQAFLYLHIKNEKEFYKKQIEISLFKGKALVTREKLDSVNFPISIRKPSVYQVPFLFNRAEKYNIKISMPQVVIPISIDFIYPKKSFSFDID